MANELYHHGVLGMKWGVRRYQNRDGSYKSGAKGRYNPDNETKSSSSTSGSSSVRSTSTGSKSHRGLSDSQKKAIKLGVAVAGTALAAYGGYKLYKSGALNPVLEKVTTKGKSAAIAPFELDGLYTLESYLKTASGTPHVTPSNRTMNRSALNFESAGLDLSNLGSKKSSDAISFENLFDMSAYEKLNKVFGEATQKTAEFNNRYKDSAEEFTKSLLNKNLRDLEKLDLY